MDHLPLPFLERLAGKLEPRDRRNKANTPRGAHSKQPQQRVSAKLPVLEKAWNETIHLIGKPAHVTDISPSSGLNVAFNPLGSQPSVPNPTLGPIVPFLGPRVTILLGDLHSTRKLHEVKEVSFPLCTCHST